MEEDGETREDLKMPDAEKEEELYKQIKDKLDNDGECMVTVQKAMGMEAIVGVKSVV